MEVILEPNGELRCRSTLELLGHHFILDGIKYYIPIKFRELKTAP